jgi:serine/threonine protein kinase
MQPRPLLPNRVLFPGNSCRSETRDYSSSIHANEMLGKFHSILGAPSQTDVEEFARMAGDVMSARASFFKSSSESARQQAVEQTQRLLTNGYSRLVPGPTVDFSVKYSQAHADCPPALMLLSQMLSYSPSKRISCSQALRHDFLNPGHADVTVDGTVGDDGHERAKRTAVKLKQLDIEALCQDRKTRIRDRDKIAQLLTLEAELIKLPGRPHSGRGGFSRTPSAASISSADGRESC